MAHVVVVDGNPGVVEVVRAALEGEGYDATRARTPKDATAAWINNRPDAAVVAAVLPHGSGLEVACGAIGLGIPVMIMKGNPKMQRDLTAAGCPFLAKPFRMDRLLAEIRTLLRSTPEERAALRDLLLRVMASREASHSRDWLDRARSNRMRAEEYCAAGEQMQSPAVRATYRRLAESYEAMATHLEELAEGPRRGGTEVG